MWQFFLTFAAFLSANVCCSQAQGKSAQVPSQTPVSQSQSVTPGPSEELKRPNGVLLGTHWPGVSGENHSGDRTWWIAELGGEIQVRELPNLLIPRKDGFWMAGTKYVKAQCYFESYIWVAPLGTPPKSHHPGNSQIGCHDERTTRDLLFLGTNHLAVQQFESAMGAAYGESAQFYVSNLEHPNWNSSENKAVLISDVLGAEGTRAFNEALGAMGEAKDDSLECGKIVASPADWGIRHIKGRWFLKGSGSRGDHVCDGYFGTEFDIKMRPPKTLVGYDELQIGWDKIEKGFPDAKDAFESPNENFAIVIVGQQLVICRLASGELGTVVARHLLHENEYVVMAQWALGSSVARWDEKVRLTHPPGAR
jgi:hypothetical protein